MSLLTSLENRGATVLDKAGHPFNGMPYAAVDKIVNSYQSYTNHFMQWEGPNAVTGTEAGGWTLTVVEAGAGDGRIDVDEAASGGVLKMLTDAADNDNLILQMTGEPFRHTSGQQLWFFIRAKVSDANLGETLFGLTVTDTAPIAGFPTDGFFFEKEAAGTGWDFHARKNGTSSESTNINTLLDNTFRIVGFHIQANGDIKVYDGTTINGLTEVASVDTGNANISEDDDLSILLAVQTTSTAAQTLSVDWLMVCQQTA